MQDIMTACLDENISETERNAFLESLNEHKCDNVGCKETKNLKLCARCKIIQYCSSTCQKQHWKEHKKLCGKIINTTPNNVKKIHYPNEPVSQRIPAPEADARQARLTNVPVPKNSTDRHFVMECVTELGAGKKSSQPISMSNCKPYVSKNPLTPESLNLVKYTEDIVMPIKMLNVMADHIPFELRTKKALVFIKSVKFGYFITSDEKEWTYKIPKDYPEFVNGQKECKRILILKNEKRDIEELVTTVCNCANRDCEIYDV